MNLWDLAEYSKAAIKSVNGFLPAGQCQRLKELGFQAGEAIQCMKRTPFSGPRVYQVAGTVFSLAKDVATSIEIE